MTRATEPPAAPRGGPASGDAAGQPYPRHWEADVLAADGGVVHLRPIRLDDADRIVALHSRLSERTRYLRYFGAYPQIPPRDLDRLVRVDYTDRVALVAELGDELIAVGRYDRTGEEEAPDTAEVAFVVEDAHQRRGIGSVLLEHLAAAARERGVRAFVAYVLAENPGMVRVFLDAGYHVEREYESGLIHLTFPIEPTEQSVAVTYEREQRAEARSIERLLTPRSVAVIGASGDPRKIGRVVFGNLLDFEPRGPVYPINPDARHVAGVRAYPSVLDVPDDIDLAVVAVPVDAVAGVVEQCAAKRVRGLVVLSGGFGERDARGWRAERELVAAARAHGMRVVGPNCLGVVNTDEAVRLNATLAPLARRTPGRGRVGFFCQSGALGIAILEEAARRGLGLTTFVSAGNRADVSVNDLLQYWESDRDTEVVLLWLESFGNPRKFARLARRLARSKPIVAVKSGRYGTVQPGLPEYAVPVPDERLPALFEASGVIRVETVAQLFDVGQLLAYQPLPTGRRVAVVTDSSALGALAADACATAGLTLAAIPTPDAPGPDAPGSGAPGPGAPGPGVAGADAAGPGVAGADAAGPDAAGPDVPEPAARGPAAAGADVAEADVGGADVAGPDVPEPDVPEPAARGPAARGSGLAGADVAEADVAGPDAAGPDVPEPAARGPAAAGADVAEADVAEADVAEADVAEADVGGADAVGPDFPRHAAGSGAGPGAAPPLGAGSAGSLPLDAQPGGSEPAQVASSAQRTGVHDIGPDATAEDLAVALRTVTGDPQVDALVVVFVPPLAGSGDDVARVLAERTAGWDRPVVSTFLAMDGVPEQLRRTRPDGTAARGSIPSYPSPERAVLALANVVRYAEWRRRPAGTVPPLSDVDEPAARAVVDAVLAADPAGRDLTADEVARLLGAYGVTVECGQSTVDGAAPGADGSGPVTPDGVACVVGVVDDPSFGALVSFGLAGLATDLLGDRAYAAVPLTDEQAGALLRAPRAAPLLSGYRGGPEADTGALADLLLRVARLVDDLPEVLAAELRPVLARPDGVSVRAARAWVGPPTSRVPAGPRRLF